jgi:hypothetical protein
LPISSDAGETITEIIATWGKLVSAKLPENERAEFKAALTDISERLNAIQKRWIDPLMKTSQLRH